MVSEQLKAFRPQRRGTWALATLLAATLAAQAQPNLEITLLQAQVALENAQGAGAVLDCQAHEFTRLGTNTREATAYFTLQCLDPAKNWVANINVESGLTTWMRCAMFRMLADGVGSECLVKLDEWE